MKACISAPSLRGSWCRCFVRKPFSRRIVELLVPCGAVAQLGEHLLCKQGVSGSIPLSSTI